MSKGITNDVLINVDKALKMQYSKTKSKVWLYAAKILSRPARRRVTVNLNKINKLAKEGDMVIVPGKVLGNGKITKKITIAAFSFSEEALEKIRSSDSTGITLVEAIKENPEGKNVKIII
ncbi:MAG: 50S ribosomal protein L18e [Caldisphaera sp.]|jgi:large subunit ribosomal protein L18e|nr:50S ribosomal protein L18e [Caldisphaera sp.]PMP59470.1 MAG: 50S ribosomal protein L18e [Caldisphaera sp.]